MKEFWAKVKKIDYRHYICAVILLASVLMSVFVFQKSFTRMTGSAVDFGNAFVDYLEMLLSVQLKPEEPLPPVVDPTPPPIEVPGVSDGESWIPATFDGFAENWTHYWALFASSDNAVNYFHGSFRIIMMTLQMGVMLIPVIFGIIVLLKFCVKKAMNNNHGAETKPLRAFKWLSKRTYHPMKEWILDFFGFLLFKGYGIWWKLWAFVWLYNFRIISIFFSFFAVWFELSGGFQLQSAYQCLFRMVSDIQFVVTTIPLPMWILLGWLLFDSFRQKIGVRILRIFETRNRSFLKTLPLGVLIDGSMGTGKTALMVDIILSLADMFRENAKNDMLKKCVLHFPAFPWEKYRCVLADAIKHKKIRNWDSADTFVEKYHWLFTKTKNINFLWGYDLEIYPITYDDELKSESIWEALALYAKLYYLYTLDSSLIIANLAIREDGELVDCGNMPIYEVDYFRKGITPEWKSKFSHILDFDIMRPGKKMKENNPLAGSFEFGVIGVTEIGKERLNGTELNPMKGNVAEANQKNDYTDLFVKMIRHMADLGFYSYSRFITDEQRVMSLSANFRELFLLLHIVSKDADRITMPFFSLGELIYSALFSWFEPYCWDYAFRRGDTTLRMYIFMQLMGKVLKYYYRIHNRFGYNVLNLETERGTQDGAKNKERYYCTHKKGRSNRYRSDCFHDLFRRYVAKTGRGINDLPVYGDVSQSTKEMKLQNSYFVQRLLGALEPAVANIPMIAEKTQHVDEEALYGGF